MKMKWLFLAITVAMLAAAGRGVAFAGGRACCKRLFRRRRQPRHVLIPCSVPGHAEIGMSERFILKGMPA